MAERKHLFSSGDSLHLSKLYLLAVAGDINVLYKCRLSSFEINFKGCFSGNMYVPLFILCYVSWRNKKVTTYKRITKLSWHFSKSSDNTDREKNVFKRILQMTSNLFSSTVQFLITCQSLCQRSWPQFICFVPGALHSVVGQAFKIVLLKVSFG